MSTPTLPSDRVEAMRSQVMRAIDQDIARRRHSARRALGMAAASVVVVGLGAVAVTAVNTGSGDQSASIAADSAGKSESSAAASAPEADRQVITTGSVSVTVDSPRKSAAKLATFVEGLGGRVDNRNENGTGDEAGASLEVRVPATKVSTLVETLKSYGTVNEVSLQNEDVTSVAQDLDARIEALKISVGRLQAILSKASTSKEVISAEGALTKRQEELESLQSQRRGLAGQVELSSLSVDFRQKASVGSVEPGGFTGGLRDGWNALASTVNHLVELVGVLLPWALVAGLVLAAIRLVGRRKLWN